jgi:phage shock protein C
MTAHATTSQGRFTRNADRAILGGVCAGVADYFGFNLRVTRLLAVIAFCFAMPVTILSYIAVVLLVPAESARYSHATDREFRCSRRRKRRRMSRRQRREAAEESRQAVRDALDERARSLDERLARVEKYVTSSRYDLDREFRNLRD